MSTVHAPSPRRLQPSPRRDQPARRQPPLRVVDHRRRARPRGAGAVTAIATVVIFVALFALAVLQAWLVQGQQRLDRVNQQVAEAQTEYQRLRLEVAQLESPARVVDAAINQLGMVPAGDTTYLTPPAPVNDAAAMDEPAASSDALVAHDNWTTIKPYLGSGQ